MSTAASLATPGTLVRARDREWVVLPNSSDELLLVRPVGGLDEETTGILPAIEPVASARFALPTADDFGDHAAGRLLRDAARLSTRASAGPFRSFGRIAIEPRPYQLVPLMMALRLDPIRLLIADDVGIGKTIEAALIARELLDRGEVKGFAVLTPPHLAEQWQKELREKFHVEAELVLSSTILKLERGLPLGTSVFDRYPFTVVSTDFIKSPRRAEDFALKCPDLVIVDEAHGATLQGGVGRGRQQRHDLLRRVTEKPDRHVILVTATPHSGNEEAFRSLLALLDRELAYVPTDLDRSELEGVRRRLARHLVQRRRADIRHYLETDTAFPERLDKESTYVFSKVQRELFDDVLEFARSYLHDDAGGEQRRFVRYWDALALMRCVSSSPQAAASTLDARSKSKPSQAATEDEASEVAGPGVFDTAEDDSDADDTDPASLSEASSERVRRAYEAFRRRALAIAPEDDLKLQGAIREIRGLLRDGFHPVVFCRYVATAEYVARHLREALPQSVRVESVTGALPPAEREARVAALVEDGGDYVLVATDCLSEGINLQEHFGAVFHYDLAWNPTRHEQREGRVDRFGQPRPEVRVITYYGTDNPIDGVILEVLLRKHKSIKSALGVSVNVPASNEQIAKALFEGALFREGAGRKTTQGRLAFEEYLEPTKRELHEEWDRARDREKASRSRFAQHALDPDEVAAELSKVQAAIGSTSDVRRFLASALARADVPVTQKNGALIVHLSPASPRGLRQAIGRDEPFTGVFDLPVPPFATYLHRTSPVVEGVAAWVLDQALDAAARDGSPVAARCAVTRTEAVRERTTLLVVRLRYQLKRGRAAETLLAEEIVTLAATGPAESPSWLLPEATEALLDAQPAGNLVATAQAQQSQALLDALPRYQAALAAVARDRAQAQLEAHERVREAARLSGRTSIEPVLPVDILGAYALIPGVR